MGKLTISMAIFNSFLYVYQAGYSPHLSLSKQLDNPKKAVLTEQCPQKCNFQQDFFISWAV
jgi:hypothetical protein